VRVRMTNSHDGAGSVTSRLLVGGASLHSFAVPSHMSPEAKMRHMAQSG
jgi:hypothetical protein